MQKICSRFKEVRRLLNKSQTALAHDLEISKQAISNIETAKSLPSVSVLSKLLDLYEVNINYLLSGEGNIFISAPKKKTTLKKTIMIEVEKFLETKGYV